MNRSNGAFRAYLIGGALGIVGYFLLPAPAQNVALIVSNLVALTAVLYAWRTRRLAPTSGWLLLAAFPAATAVGNTVYFVNDSILSVQPFPSPGDAAFLGGYLVLAAGLLRIHHHRSADRDPAAVLDVAIITVAFAAASWVFFMAPLLHDAAEPLSARLVALGYPVGDVLVLAVAARFFLSARRRGPVFGWLAATVVVMLVADTAFALLNLEGLYATGHPVDALILIYNLGWGAVALHRDAADLTLPPDTRSTRPAWARLAALAAAFLIPAVVMLIQVLRGHLEDVPVIAAAGLLLFLLVMVRMSVIVLTLERVLQERTALEQEVAGHTVELNRIASIVTSSSDAIVGLSLDGVVTSWNPAAEKLYGRPVGAAVNRPQDIVTAEQFDQFRASLAAEDVDATAGSQEIHFTRADGSTVPVAMTISPIRSGGSLTGVSVIGQDITERRRAEASLKEARAEALEASRLKSEFLATMSHEIRTPMNGVTGLTELLLRTPLDDVQRQYATGVQSASAALLLVINDILDFSKLEAGKVDLELRDFDPRQVVEEVGALLAREAETKGLELIAYCVPDVPVLLTGDAGRIRQVLLNLASNAVKFTASGEVVIRLHTMMTPEGTVSARFEVADTGIGISPASQQRLFTSFSQADASTTRRYGGTGLGLAICLRLVEAMDGEIGLDSEEGVGSRFWFRLPLSLSASPPDPDAAYGGLPAGLRVLVLDNNTTTGSVLSAQLRSWDLHTDVVADGAAVLTTLRQGKEEGQPYDIAILDLSRSDADGLQVVETIAADPELRDTKTLVITSVLRLDATALRQAGVSRWLTKPVATAALRHQLEQLVSLAGPPPSRSPTTFHPVPDDGRVPARILVVEDNALNQLVAEGVVTLLGHQPDLVTNGVEALAALSHATYGAVLMDCHMPVMDGYEATRELRRREGTGRRTPVIAMTASAMAQDRERALAAGMDDYLSKPIVLQTLAEMLARWLEPGADAAAKPDPPVGEGAEVTALDVGEEPVLDGERLGSLQQLGQLQGVDLMAKLADLFSRDSAAALADLRAAVDGGDRSALEHAAHKLKGAAANIGAVRVAALCHQLEVGAAAESAAGRGHPAVMVDELDGELDRARAALHEWPGTLQSIQPNG